MCTIVGESIIGFTKSPFFAINAKGGESMSPKQKDRTTTNFKFFEIKFSLGIFQNSIHVETIFQLVSIFQIDIFKGGFFNWYLNLFHIDKTLLNTKGEFHPGGVLFKSKKKHLKQEEKNFKS
jgi:hypothetical protein